MKHATLRAALLVFAALLFSADAPGQAAQTPPRDSVPKDAKGTAVIRGRVVAADTKKPLRRVQLRLSGDALSQPRSTSTDAQGSYEFGGLPAGRYSISAGRGGYLRLDYGQRRPNQRAKIVDVADGQTLDRIDFALPRMSIISGRITDEFGEPIAQVNVAPYVSRYFLGRRRLVLATNLAVTDDTGQYRIIGLPPGDYSILAVTHETWTVEHDGARDVLAYLPTYYPGTSSQAEARRVRIGLGQEYHGVDFSLMPGRTATVSGFAFDNLGQPLAGSRVTVTEVFRGVEYVHSWGHGWSATVTADGTWSMAKVPPGTYLFEIGGYVESKSDKRAVQTVTVAGADVEGVMLTAVSQGRARGMVIADEGMMPTGAVGKMGVTARPVDPDAAPRDIGAYRTTGTVREDGSFQLEGLFGPVRIYPVSLPVGWALRSVSLEGRDVTDTPIEVKPGEEVTGIQIVITRRTTKFAGQVLDAKAHPTGDATVLVFAADSARWGEESRWVRVAQPDRDGKFRIEQLPAGNYLAIALDDVEDGAWADPEFLESLRMAATSLALLEGESLEMTLTIKSAAEK